MNAGSCIIIALLIIAISVCWCFYQWLCTTDERHRPRRRP